MSQAATAAAPAAAVPDPQSVRHRSFEIFSDASAQPMPAGRHWLMRAQNFVVQRIECDAPLRAFPVESPYELLLLLPEIGATVRSADRDPVTAPGHSLCILPAGRHEITLDAPGLCCVLGSVRPDLDAGLMINAVAYEQPDPRIAPVRPHRRLRGQGEVHVMPISTIQAPAASPRLRFIQTDTMSINWVEYEGARTRTQLSPHTHSDLEQGSLAIMGNYIHPLRVEWGRNADLWRDDEHLQAPSPSLMIVPVNMLHTTEGVGDGRHILIDVFAPPRPDFIAKGWVFNSADYEAPAGQA